MYKSINYDYKTKKYYLRDTNKDKLVFNYNPVYYKPDPKGKFKTLFGDRVSQTFSYPENGYEIDVDKKTRLLVDLYFKEDEPPKKLNVLFLDIEIELIGQLTELAVIKTEAEFRSVVFYQNGVKKRLIIDKDNKIKKDENTFTYPNETEFLKGVLKIWKQFNPDIVSGWNSKFFDIPYMYHRIWRVLGKKQADSLSPFGIVKSPIKSYSQGHISEFIDKVKNKKLSVRDWKRDLGLTYTEIYGVNQLDYLLLHKKFIMKQEPSYKLDDIGEKYVKMPKLEYVGNLNRLYEEDINKFLKYNERDVDILVELDKKLKFIDLTLNISHLCHVPYENIFYSTMMNEGAILTYLKRKNIVSPNKPYTINPDMKDNIKRSYAGGYLKAPKPGLYKWVIDLDFTSLYPFIIRSLNIGIESYMFRIMNRGIYDNKWSLRELKELDPNKILDIELVTRDKKEIFKKIKVSRIIDLIEKENIKISANGVLYRTDVKSVVVEILSDWFNKRKKYKSLRSKAWKNGDKELYDYYDLLQHSYKIKLNDVYGVFAIDNWRYTDGYKHISSSITLTGQRLTQESIKFTNKLINEELGTKDKDYIITSDTDSLYIHLEPILKHRFPNLDLENRKEVVPKVLEIAKEFQDKNNKNLNILAKELFNIQDEHFFNLKQEVVLERGYFSKKRRYAMYIVNKEGDDIEELIIMGLNIMKSDFPKMFKDFGEELIQKIMYGYSKEKIDQFIIDFKTKIDKSEPKKIAKPTGINKYLEYVLNPPRKGEILSNIKKGCPINTRSAIYYNDLLTYYGRDKIYPKIRVGDKIYILHLKKNPFNIESIAMFSEGNPPEIMDFIKKYYDKEKIFNSVLKNKIEGIYNDIGWEQVQLNPNVRKFFTFN